MCHVRQFLIYSTGTFVLVCFNWLAYLRDNHWRLLQQFFASTIDTLPEDMKSSLEILQENLCLKLRYEYKAIKENDEF